MLASGADVNRDRIGTRRIGPLYTDGVHEIGVVLDGGTGDAPVRLRCKNCGGAVTIIELTSSEHAFMVPKRSTPFCSKDEGGQLQKIARQQL